MPDMIYGWVHRPAADEGPDPVRRLWVPTTDPEDLSLPSAQFVPAQAADEALDALRAANPCPPWPEGVPGETNWSLQRVWLGGSYAGAARTIVESRWPAFLPGGSAYLRLTYADVFTKIIQPTVTAAGAVVLAPYEHGTSETARELTTAFRKCPAFRAADVVISEVGLKVTTGDRPARAGQRWHVVRYDPNRADGRRKAVGNKESKARTNSEAAAALAARQNTVDAAYGLARAAAVALWTDVPALLAFALPGSPRGTPTANRRLDQILGHADYKWSRGLFPNALEALFVTADLHEAVTAKGRWRKHPAVREAVDAFAAVWADATDEKVSPGVRPDGKDVQPGPDGKRPLGRWIARMGREIAHLKKTRAAEKAAATRAAKAAADKGEAVLVPAC